MLHLFKVIIVLLWACACTAQLKIDWKSLVMCSDKCRLPWQTCATCFVTNLDLPVGYCSDRTELGLCKYKDEQISCECTPPENDIFYRQTAQIMGTCQTNRDCPAMHRCATCLASKYPNVPPGGISPQKVCSTSQNGPYQDACDPIWQKTCSCGQMLPVIHNAATFEEQNLAYEDQNLLDIPPPIDYGAEVDLNDAWN